MLKNRPSQIDHVYEWFQRTPTPRFHRRDDDDDPLPN